MLFDNDFQVPLSVFAHGSESGNSTWLEPPERGPSAKLGHWRKAKKVWTSSMISQYHPPSANQDSWRRGWNFPRDMQIFHLSRHHLAEGVEFPEKNAGSRVLEPSFGGGGPPVGSATRLVAILNYADF